jgi:pseudouridine kinase
LEAGVVCIGGATIDRKYRAAGPVRPGTSNPMTGSRRFGGVARNVAENLARLGTRVSLVSRIGEGPEGRAILDHLAQAGVDAALVDIVPGERTAEYVAVLDGASDLVVGIADMAVFDGFGPDAVARAGAAMDAAAWVFADCNLPAATLADLLARRRAGAFRLAVDTVSTPKAVRLPRDLSGIDLIVLNRDEAAAWLGNEGVDAAGAVAGLRAAGAAAVVLTQGAAGVLVGAPAGLATVPAAAADPVDVTGAGDALIAGTIHRLIAGDPLTAAVRAGTVLAALTIETDHSVRPDLSAALLDDRIRRSTDGGNRRG